MALSLSSSSSSRTWLYDVFPSFSGEDVRVTFLSHFLKELDRKLIIAFKDSEIQRSRSLDPELKHAIRDSRIAVVIFSNNYASSSWCLNELLEIVKCKEECGQLVIPVFYGLEPSHVRKQTGDFGTIFEETCHNKTEEEKIQWRRALTDVANILGYHSVTWGSEAKMIEKIANDVLDKLLLTPSKDSENFVGIEDHIAKMSLLLQLENKEVRMVGLWGSSGIGKTTIARVLFQRLSRHFQGSIFIDRAFVSKSMEIFSRANPDDYNMKLHLQRNFLSEILGRGDIKINHLSAIGDRLKHQKVLIFIDDFDDRAVLDALIGQTQWFGSGSRIVVVTNDKHFLRAHGIDHIYQVCLPSEDLAQEMLCRSAFRKKTAPEGFMELVVKVAGLAGSLPLGLNVLGSSLRGRDKDYWMDMLPMLQTGIDGKIERTLKVSYNGLSKGDKTLFRHLACLFNGEKVAYLKLLLADSGLSVNVGLTNLADKSLIHVYSWGHVEMHRLLQEMGRSIVRLEEPEKREFLVDSQDICDVLSQGTGTPKVLGISLNTDESGELYLHENAFTGMRNLRYLKIYSEDIWNEKWRGEVKCQLPESFEYLPPKLKLLCWLRYPMRCMPSKFRPENLVKFEMRYSKLEKLWEGVVALPYLKKMDLGGSENLIEMPDLSKATNLEELDLSYCYSLVKLPSSIPHPNKLKELNMRNCQNLETIPIGISLKSLEKLYLDGCSRLRTFPQISTNLAFLNIDETSIEEIPSNFHMGNLRFENLFFLSMKNLKSKKLWERMQPLTFLTAIMSPSLDSLHLSDIPTLVELPISFQNLHQLTQLNIKNCVNLETLPTGVNISYLIRLNLSGCSQLKAFPGISRFSTNIRYLNLSKTAIEEVPRWIEKLSRLKDLKMKGCINLETLPTGINLQSLRDLDLSGCSRLSTFPDISTNIKNLYLNETRIKEVPPWIEKLSRLKDLKMNGCINLETLPTGINLQSLRDLDLSGCSRLSTFPDISTNIKNLYLNETRIKEVPPWIEKLSRLKDLKMKGCINLETLPTGINLQSLRDLDLSGCSRLSTFPDISTNIKNLYLNETRIKEVPPWIEKLSRLKDLKMNGCINLETLPTGINLQSLRDLDLSGCSRLSTFPDISTNIKNLYLNETRIKEVPPWIEKLSRLKDLKMKGCINLETLPTGINLQSLRDLDLSGCSRLSTFPDISTNIKNLYLNETRIKEVPPWIEKLSRLKDLKMKGCINLETLPTGINLQSLRDLDLSGCSRLSTFPDISTNIKNLYLNETRIKEVPPWIEKFSCLRELKMKGCINLETLPTGINLQSLRDLDLSGCSKLRTFPDISINIEKLLLSETEIKEVPLWIEKFSKLEDLHMEGCLNLETLPTGINLQSLRDIDLTGCSRLKTFPDISTNIERLFLSQTAIEEVPLWIEKFSNLESVEMKGCNNLEYVNLKKSKLPKLYHVDFSDCKALTGASWSDNSIFSFSGGHDTTSIYFTNCFSLDQEALFQQETYLGCQLWLPGEAVPSYFTHRTTPTSSSSLTIPLLPSSLSQPFLRFRACVVLNCDNMSENYTEFRFTGRFWNSSESYDQAQDFCADTKECAFIPYKKKEDSLLFIFDCKMSHIPLEKNFDYYTHVDLQLDVPSEYGINEWGIRLLESAECDVVTERSSKRMRVIS